MEISSQMKGVNDFFVIWKQLFINMEILPFMIKIKCEKIQNNILIPFLLSPIILIILINPSLPLMMSIEPTQP